MRDLGGRMVAALADTWRGAAVHGYRRAPVLVAAIASYVADGQPLARQGGRYSQLHELSDNAARWLAVQVSRRVGRPLDVALVHDSTAARAYAGAANAAVITLGTALGVGFVLPRGELRPVAQNLEARGVEGSD